MLQVVAVIMEFMAKKYEEGDEGGRPLTTSHVGWFRLTGKSSVDKMGKTTTDTASEVTSVAEDPEKLLERVRRFCIQRSRGGKILVPPSPAGTASGSQKTSSTAATLARTPAVALSATSSARTD